MTIAALASKITTGIALQHVARLGIFQSPERNRERNTTNVIKSPRCFVYRRCHNPAMRCRNVEKIQQQQDNCKRRPYGVIVELPPTNVRGKNLGSGAKPHIGDSQGGKPNVIAQGRLPDALLRQFGKSIIQIRRNPELGVIVRQDIQRLLPLCGRIEGPRR